jgi:AcrR family transcriptional regulator
LFDAFGQILHDDVMRKRREQASAETEQRRGQLLDAAVRLFLRLGPRKTSMEDLARAARVSRQGLYLHFSTKEELLVAAVRHWREGSLAAVRVRLTDSRSIEERLVGAFEAWFGSVVGIPAADFAELMAEIRQVTPFEADERPFIDEVARALLEAGLAEVHAGIDATGLAETLLATASGVRDRVSSREEFVRRLDIAVRALCAPLRCPCRRHSRAPGHTAPGGRP